MKLRPMTFDDIAAVAALDEEIFPPAEVWSANGYLTHLLREDTIYFVADSEASDDPYNPDIAGYAGLLMVPDEADITKIAVREGDRKKGIGKALLREILAMADKKKIRTVYLEVRESNIPAIELYYTCGFYMGGLRKGYYETPKEDAIVMLCHLAPEDF